MNRIMSLLGLAAILLSTAACKKVEQPAKDAPKATAGPPSGPPPIPPYQMRDALEEGDRLAGGRDGAKLFTNRCGACHLVFGMGTNLITKQRLAMGEPPEKGLLANRLDLTSDYVKNVVRQGKMAMPRLSKVDVTDAELDAIAAYLGKADKK